MAVRSTLKRTGPGLGSIEKAVAQLARTRLLVGVPSGSARAPEPGEKGTPPSNGVIGYLLEMGDDEMHLPPRPFGITRIAIWQMRRTSSSVRLAG